MRRVLIGVIGESTISHPRNESLAEEVGRGLAEAGYGVVCGGLTGVMEAVCRGARQAGGLTVGILMGTDPEDANRYVDVAIPTGMGHARNVVIVLASAAVVAIGAGYGTLSEIGHALKLGKPVIGLRTWRAEVGEVAAPIRYADSAAEAVRLVREIVEGRGGRR